MYVSLWTALLYWEIIVWFFEHGRVVLQQQHLMEDGYLRCGAQTVLVAIVAMLQVHQGCLLDMVVVTE